MEYRVVSILYCKCGPKIVQGTQTSMLSTAVSFDTCKKCGEKMQMSRQIKHSILNGMSTKSEDLKEAM